MAQQKEPLRALSQAERAWLERVSRSQSETSAVVARAKSLLAVAEGRSFAAAARRGRWRSRTRTRRPKEALIRRAHREAEPAGLALWNEDEAGPYQAIPQPGSHWAPEGEPQRVPHEYVRGGTTKLMTLFHPASGAVRLRGVESVSNAVLHPWIQEQISQILASLPEREAPRSPEENRAEWESWQEGLSVRFTLPHELPPLRMLLIWDNLAGHHSAQLLCWLMSRGVMVLFTPLGGSWLNLAESIQRILVRRALTGTHPKSPQEVIGWLEAVARAWNRDPTPFEWGDELIITPIEKSKLRARVEVLLRARGRDVGRE